MLKHLKMVLLWTYGYHVYCLLWCSWHLIQTTLNSSDKNTMILMGEQRTTRTGCLYSIIAHAKHEGVK